MSDAFKQIEETWFLIRDNFDDLYQPANSKERLKLLSNRDAARDAYYLAVGKAFDDDDAFVADTTKELAAATKAFKAALEELQEIAEKLRLLTSAVKLLAALSAMVIL